MKIYGIGGLGADERVFSKLQLNYDFVFLPWLSPGSDEHLSDYVRRFGSRIDTRDEFCILGVSFGGIVAQELGQWLQPKMTFLVSSAVNPSEIPWPLRTMAKHEMFNSIPNFFLKPPSILAYRMFGTGYAEDRALLKQIIKDTDPGFLKWALHQLGIWQNSGNSIRTRRIHGANDRLLACHDRSSVIVQKAGHFMIVTNAQTISAWVNRSIQRL